jgi:hypothetical protein
MTCFSTAWVTIRTSGVGVAQAARIIVPIITNNTNLIAFICFLLNDFVVRR